MLNVRTGGMMSPNLPELAQHEVDKIIRYADENGEPSPCFDQFNSLRGREQSSAWIEELICLLGHKIRLGDKADSKKVCGCSKLGRESR
jgi:hypothetical protein